MIIFHDKDGNRLAMTEAEALALGYTYEHIWKRGYFALEFMEL